MRIAAFLIAIIIFSQLGNIIRLSDSHPITTTFWRLLLATAILLPFAIWKKSHREVLLLKRKQVRSLVMSSIYLMSAFTIFIYAVIETTIGNAMLIFSIHPVITALLSHYILKDKIELKTKFSIFIALLAIFIVFAKVQSFNEANLTGGVFALIAALFFSLFMLEAKTCRKKLTNLTFTTCLYGITSLIGLLLILILDIQLLNNSTQSWGSFILLAIFPTLLGHSLFTYCMKFFNINVISCGMVANIPIAVLSASFFFDEKITSNIVFATFLASIAVMSLFLKNPLRIHNGKLIFSR